jgi:hypothetical protein
VCVCVCVCVRLAPFGLADWRVGSRVAYPLCRGPKQRPRNPPSASAKATGSALGACALSHASCLSFACCLLIAYCVACVVRSDVSTAVSQLTRADLAWGRGKRPIAIASHASPMHGWHLGRVLLAAKCTALNVAPWLRSLLLAGAELHRSALCLDGWGENWPGRVGGARAPPRQACPMSMFEISRVARCSARRVRVALFLSRPWLAGSGCGHGATATPGS